MAAGSDPGEHTIKAVHSSVLRPFRSIPVAKNAVLLCKTLKIADRGMYVFQRRGWQAENLTSMRNLSENSSSQECTERCRKEERGGTSGRVKTKGETIKKKCS